VERIEFPDDDDPIRPLLPQDDRVWRHPSEVGPPPGGYRAAPEAGRRGAWTVAMVVGSAATLTMAVVLAGIAHLSARNSGPRLVLEADNLGAGTLARAADAAGTVGSTLVSVVTGHSGGRTDTSAVTTARSGVAGPAAPGGPPLEVRTSDGTVEQVTSGLLLAGGLVVTTSRAVAGAKTIDAQVDGVDRVLTVLAFDAGSGLSILSIRGTTPTALPRTGTAIGLREGAKLHTGSRSMTATAVTTSGHIDGHDVGPVILVDASSLRDGQPVMGPDGRVVGITINLDEGVGVSPVEVVRAAARLAKSPKLATAVLGVSGRADTDTGLGRNGGARIVSLDAEGAAAKAGVAVHDLVVDADDTEVRSMWDLLVAVRSHRGGDLLHLEVVRDGQASRIVVKLAGAH
jgi:S1-C subfamily serine protease